MLTITSFKVTLETGGGTVVALTGQILHQHQLLLSQRTEETLLSIGALPFQLLCPTRVFLLHFPSNTSVKSDKSGQIKTLDFSLNDPHGLSHARETRGTVGGHASVFVDFILLKPKQETRSSSVVGRHGDPAKHQPTL